MSITLPLLVQPDEKSNFSSFYQKAAPEAYCGHAYLPTKYTIKMAEKQCSKGINLF